VLLLASGRYARTGHLLDIDVVFLRDVAHQRAGTKAAQFVTPLFPSAAGIGAVAVAVAAGLVWAARGGWEPRLGDWQRSAAIRDTRRFGVGWGSSFIARCESASVAGGALVALPGGRLQVGRPAAPPRHRRRQYRDDRFTWWRLRIFDLGQGAGAGEGIGVTLSVEISNNGSSRST
jgi:hypothetical protein